MKKLLFLFIILLSSSTFAQELLFRDPYQTQFSQQPSLLLKVRVLNHGVRDAAAWVREQIQAAEVIFSQCGKRVKIEITQLENLPFSIAQDHLLDFSIHGQTFTNEALDFFKLTSLDKSDEIMDIHLVDHLNSEIRRLQSTINQTLELGVSFNPNLFGWTYFGASPKLAARTLFLAAETTRLESKNFIRIGNLRGHSRNLSLLAHELGHQLLESQVEKKDIYFDHWCAEMNDECPSNNLMNAGGNTDQIWKNSMTDKIEGYDPLPLINHTQCETLFNHPMVKKLNPYF